MSRLTIDTGTAGNPATGDSLRTAFNKVNTNFTELYAELGGDSLDAISFNNNTISTDITNANLILTGNGTGGVVIEDIEITGSTVNVLTTNNNLTLNTNGTGKVVINGLSFPTADGTAGQVLKTDGAGNLSFTDSASAQGITFVGDDSTGTRVSDGESFKIAGGTGLTSVVSGDTITLDIDSTVATLTGSQELTNKTLTTPKIDLIKDANGNEVLGFSTTASATDYLVIKNGIGVGSPLHIYAEGDSANIGVHLQPKGTGIFTISDGADFNKGIRFRSSSSAASAITLIDAVSSAGRVVTLPDATDTLVGRATEDTLTNKSISLTTNTITGTVITMVGDDSSGTAVNIGETFKIAGTQNVSTAVSGDTLTITGPNLSSYLTNSTLTVVGDDSTGVTLNSGETIKIAGTQNITTAVSGDTLTITGPDLSSYITDDGLGDLTVVGSTIQSPSNADITLDPSGTGAIRLHSDVKMKPATSITIGEPSEEVYRIWTQSLYVALNGLSNSYTLVDYEGINFVNNTYGGHITLSDYAEINSAYTTTFRNRFGNNFIIRTSPGKDFVLTSENGIGGEPQSAIRVHAADNRVNINDISISGTTIQTETTNADLTLQGNGTGGVNVPGTLTANIFVTNAISSGDSTAIQINDAINVSGEGTFHGSVRFNAGYTEKINALTSSSTITVNCAAASIHTVTLAVSTGFVISNLPTGGTVTLIITQGGSGSYTATFGTDGSTTVKFPGGAPTLSTAVGAIDVVTIFNDGTNYLGNIAKAYAA
jgi:hypothetical protein